ncbi:sensor histidine kinase [Aquirhabdus sp.]|uniref:sensor histidine kinase n=1 Tax=Aquirhabdus sp. TaxID=2824160 RepID=UPI00396CC613
MWSSSVRKHKINASIANSPKKQTNKPVVPNASVEIDHAFFIPRFSEGRALIRLMVLASLLALFFALSTSSSFEMLTWERLFVFTFFMNWVAVSFAIVAEFLRQRLMRWSRIRAVFVCYVIIGVIVVVYTILVNTVEVLTHLKPWDSLALQEQVIHHLVLAMIISGVVLHYLYMREQLLIRERAELFARLDTLQARIHPHFLFNSMNTLLSLIETDSHQAGAVVEDLSALFRASLQSSGEVTLADEVMLCRRYLAIESLRLGERLQVEWHIPDESILKVLKIPSLTLQPLLENAVVHGVEVSANKSLITVLIEWAADEIKIVVTNPIHMGNAHHSGRSGNQMALSNIHERLQAQYGTTARLTTHRAREFFTAYLCYPFTRNV